MAFTDPFIRRPVLATVVSLLIVLLGFQAWSKLPLRQYPQMENALITVTTAYPGANAETIQGYITQPMQQSLASAEGIDYMTSVSRQNFSVISIYARIGSNSDRLFTELLAKANEVKNQLPQDAEDPVLSKEAADASALMYISFFSKELSNPQITDYLSRVIQPKLATLPGMAEAEILGNQVFAMRLWLDPQKHIVVPESAITYTLYGNSIYVVGQKKSEDGNVEKDDKGQPVLIAERRFIETGERRDGLVMINKGVQSGEQVVTAGQIKLDNGARIAISDDKTLGEQNSPPRAD